MTDFRQPGAIVQPAERRPGLLARLVQVRYPYVDLLAAQRARGLVRISVVTGLAWFFALLYLLAMFSPGAGYELLDVAALLGGIVGIGLTIMLVQRGQERAASLVLIGVVTVGISLAVFPFGYDNVAALALSVPLILAGTLFGWGGALVVLGLLLAVLMASTIAVQMNLIVNVSMAAASHSPLNIIVFGGVELAIDAVILRTFMGLSPRVDARSRAQTSDRRLITAIFQLIADYTSLDDLLVHAGDDLRNLLNYYDIQLFTVEPNSHLLIRAARVGAISSQTRPERRILLDDQHNIVALVYRLGQTRCVAGTGPDAAADRSEFLDATQSALFVPLHYHDRIWGVLNVQSTQALGFERQDIELLELVAGRLASALQYLQTAVELRQTVTERQQLQDQIGRLAHDLDRVRHDSNRNSWTEYLSGREAGQIGFDWSKEQTTATTALNPSLEQAAGDALPQIRMDGGDQVLSVPISVRGQSLGMLVFRAQGETPWTDHSLELARLLGQRLALVLDNVRLLEQTRGAATRERLLNQIAVELQAQPDMERLLSTAAQSFSRALGATTAHVQLVVSDIPDAASLSSIDPMAANSHGNGDEV